ACYIPIGTKDSRLIQDKDGGIEVPVFAFLLPPWNKPTDKSNPYWLTHELAHAYHDRVLGFDIKAIRASYESAKNSKLYDHVETKSVGWTRRMETAQAREYARTTRLEYFGVLSVARLARNCSYAYTAQGLRKHGPGGYSLMQEIWGERRKQQ